MSNRRSKRVKSGQARTAFVYFILNPYTNLVKIGFTTGNPNVRLHALRTMNAGELKPIAVIPNAAGLESPIHGRFRKHRHHGEWFEYVDEIAEFVRKHGHPWPGTPPEEEIQEKDPDPGKELAELLEEDKNGSSAQRKNDIKLRHHKRQALLSDLEQRKASLVKRSSWCNLLTGDYITYKGVPDDNTPCPSCEGACMIGADQCEKCGGSGLATDTI